MLAQGFEEIEALAVVDILRRGELNINTVSITENKTVVGAHGISVITDITIGDMSEDFEALILPGGMPGTLNLKNCKILEQIIIKANNDKKIIGAICAAPMILGELGLLKDKTGTCYPSFENHLNGCDFKESRVCVSQNIITSRGAGTAHDFAFEILKQLQNEEISKNVRKSMLYDIK